QHLRQAPAAGHAERPSTRARGAGLPRLMTIGERRFETVLLPRPGGGIAVRLPFEPAAAWGDRDRWYVAGTIDDYRFRASVSKLDEAPAILLGPMWCRDPSMVAGRQVALVVAPEPPDSTTVAADFSSALGAQPHARRFFDSLATFYRKNYVRWIEGAKRP